MINYFPVKALYRDVFTTAIHITALKLNNNLCTLEFEICLKEMNNLVVDWSFISFWINHKCRLTIIKHSMLWQDYSVFHKFCNLPSNFYNSEHLTIANVYIRVIYSIDNIVMNIVSNLFTHIIIAFLPL